MPLDYYTTMVGVATDQKLFISMLKQHNPKLESKFRQLQLEPSIFTIQWFVCLYSSTLDIEVTHK